MVYLTLNATTSRRRSTIFARGARVCSSALRRGDRQHRNRPSARSRDGCEVTLPNVNVGLECVGGSRCPSSRREDATVFRNSAPVIGVLPSVADRDRAIESFNRSAYAQIGPDARPSVFAEPVTDWAGLTRYLLKEATPQAWYGAGKSFRRVGGSIPLGILGGDRVILSEDLRDALILGGRIAPYRRAYARRRPKAPAIIYRDELFSPLPVLAAPVRPKPAPRKRERHELPTLPLSCPPTIADMLAGLGPTHETIAQQVGLLRAQVTNVIVGRFGVSRPVARRVLELARAA